MISIHCETVPCETCGTPTPNKGTELCGTCWHAERYLPAYLKRPKGCEFVRRLIPKLDDWVKEGSCRLYHEAGGTAICGPLPRLDSRPLEGGSPRRPKL